MLSCQGLSKSFYDPGRGEVRAVNGINLELPGGVVALVGANGAGKSTLLRMVATLLQPDSGHIRVAGHDTQTAAEAVRKRIGYLSTSTRLYPRLTAREMLAYVGGFFGMEATHLDERIAVVSELFALEDFIDQRCDGLSTGQAQRVNLARTLLPDPDLLVLDEPTTGLDLVAARRVVDAVQSARRDDRLIIIATHVMAEVEELAERMLIMDRGQIVFDDTPARLGSGVDFAHAVHGYISADGRA